MEDKVCPFCGMYLKPDQVSGQVDFQCDTVISYDFPNMPQFGRDCLMRQLARCSGELGEMQARVKELEGFGATLLNWILPRIEAARGLGNPPGDTCFPGFNKKFAQEIKRVAHKLGLVEG